MNWNTQGLTKSNAITALNEQINMVLINETFLKNAFILIHFISGITKSTGKIVIHMVEAC